MAKRPQKKKEVNDLYKLTVQLRNTVLLVWLTIVGYTVYLEFFKETLTTIGPAVV
jgi:hypothetical protein